MLNPISRHVIPDIYAAWEQHVLHEIRCAIHRKTFSDTGWGTTSIDSMR